MATKKEIAAMTNAVANTSPAANTANTAAAANTATAAAENPSMDELKLMMDEIKRLRLENEEFKKRQRPVSFAVNDKGAISVSGIGKYPFTLFKTQWERVLEKKDELLEFIEEHKTELN